MAFFRRKTLIRATIAVAVIYCIFYGLPNVFVRNTGSPPPTKSLSPHPMVPMNYTTYPGPPERKKPTTTPLGKHRYRTDGLVEVNPDGPHPIYELIARAEKDWRKKLAQASTTLKDAVAEYQRRYKRMPPKGFDLWWNYAKKHNVQLPDEYDTIFNDLEPFWGMDPHYLFKTQAELEKKKDSYTVGKNVTGGDVSVLTYAFHEGAYEQLIANSVDILQLFEPIQEDLPFFRMTLSPHDAPNRLTDHDTKQKLLEAATSGTFVGHKDLPRKREIGWVAACPPKSLARKKFPLIMDEPPPPQAKKTFIHDHVKSMNPCDHISIFYHHGQLLTHNNGPSPQEGMVPEFSSCTDTIHHNVRFPVPYLWVDDIYPRIVDPVFDERMDERLLWRGRNTGIFHGAKVRWEHSHRDFLVAFANDLYGTIQVLNPFKGKNEKVGPPKVFKKSKINPALMDIAFAGNPILCSPEICDYLEEIYPWREFQTIGEAGNYKYVVDMDGNGWSGRFKRLMTSNALVFKSTIYPEWFADRVQPWVHYVPIQLDLSDLHDALVFFRGDPNGDGAHDAMAKKIAEDGRQWSKTFWRKEDLTAYLFRLTLEFARLMSEDREAMTYQEPKTNF